MNLTRQIGVGLETRMIALNADVLREIGKTLVDRDMGALACVNKHFYTESSSKIVILNNNNIHIYWKRDKDTIKKVEVLRIMGDFENVKMVEEVIKGIRCKELIIDSPIILNEHFNIPNTLIKYVIHLSISEDTMECVDVAKFECLKELTINRFTWAEPVHAQIMKHTNISKYTMNCCDFATPKYLQDYIFGGQRFEDVVESFKVPNVFDLTVLNVTSTFNGIEFDLFSLTPHWYPNLKRLVIRNCLATLKPLEKFKKLEYFELYTTCINFDNLKTSPFLKYLHLKAETIHIDKSISDLNLKSLTLDSKSLINTSYIETMPKCKTIEIVTKNGKICKSGGCWYYFKISWHLISESEALSVINKR